MGLFDALFRGMTGRSARGERRGLRQQMTDLERQTGSAKAAAEAAGVSRATWWRWKSGRSAPRPERRERLTLARRRGMVTEGRRALVDVKTSRGRLAGAGPKITATFTVSADTRHRSLTIGDPEARAHLARAAEAFEAGNDDQAAAEMQRAVDLTIGQPTIVEDGEMVEW